MNKLLYTIFPILTFYLFALNFVFYQTVFQAIGFLLSFPYFIKSLSERRQNKWIVLLLITFSVGSLLNLLVSQNGIGGTLIIFSTISLTIYVLENLHKMQYHSLIALLITLFYLAYNIFILVVEPNEIFVRQGLSRNHGGFLLILWLSFYIFVKYNKINYKGLSLIDVAICIATVIIAFFLQGRSSLGISIALTLCLLIIRKIKYTIITLGIIIAVYLYNMDFFREMFELSSFNEHSMESSRYTIWESYFSQMNFVNFLFGQDTMKIPIVAMWGGNLHNAFFNLTARAGGFSTVLLFFLIAIASYKYIKTNVYMPVILLLAICTRLLFDSDCFISCRDFVVYTIILYPLYKSKRHASNFNNNSLIQQ